MPKDQISPTVGAALMLLVACSGRPDDVVEVSGPVVTPVTPVAAWDGLPQWRDWTVAVLTALDDSPLVTDIPRDIDTFCPGFRTASQAERKAFWVSFLSVLAGEESTWRETVSGGGGRWHGLLQISPATAKGYGCEAATEAALKSGAANLTCGVTIMSQTVARDGVIADGGGVAADWGPLTRARQRDKIAAFTRVQPYCAAG